MFHAKTSASTCSRDKTSFEKSVVEIGDIVDGKLNWTWDSTRLYEWSQVSICWSSSDTLASTIGVIYIFVIRILQIGWNSSPLLPLFKCNCFVVILIISSQVTPMILHLQTEDNEITSIAQLPHVPELCCGNTGCPKDIFGMSRCSLVRQIVYNVLEGRRCP